MGLNYPGTGTEVLASEIDKAKKKTIFLSYSKNFIHLWYQICCNLIGSFLTLSLLEFYLLGGMKAVQKCNLV